jgi:hypothetical protein
MLGYQLIKQRQLRFTRLIKKIKPKKPCHMWWHISVIPELSRLRQADCEIETSLNYIVRPCLKNKQTNKQTKTSQVQQHMPITLVTWEVEAGDLKFEASPSKVQTNELGA